jgi:hypothetical protein
MKGDGRTGRLYGHRIAEQCKDVGKQISENDIRLNDNIPTLTLDVIECIIYESDVRCHRMYHLRKRR